MAKKKKDEREPEIIMLEKFIKNKGELMWVEFIYTLHGITEPTPVYLNMKKLGWIKVDRHMRMGQ